MKEERLVKRRVVPVVVLTVLTFLFTFLMGIRNTMPLDEVVVLFFLDLIFLTVFLLLISNLKRTVPPLHLTAWYLSIF